MGKFSEIVEQVLDADQSSVSLVLDIMDNSIVCFSVDPVSGHHANHEITLQKSLKDSLGDQDWADTGNVLTGLGIVDNIQTAVRYVRLKVTTVEGSPSQVKVRIQAK